MIDEKINSPFEIPLEKVQDEIRMNLNGDLEGYNLIVSPRTIETVENIVLFKKSVFERIIRRISLKSNTSQRVYPYEHSEIRTFRREPKGCEIGQTFILSKKILSIMGDLEGRVFSNFESNGLSKTPPIQIYGTDNKGRKVIGFYIPPIIEIHGRDAVLLDGIHRSYICKSAGTTIMAVHINKVSTPLPFNPISWNQTSVVDEKPPVEKRYIDLNKNYFRDLTSIGIDG